eukprot:m.171345 g.171345  ORF g.171345 m.171345 type:complete len:57 (-) comp25178_c0_seq5:1321-1491(-)
MISFCRFICVSPNFLSLSLSYIPPPSPSSKRQNPRGPPAKRRNISSKNHDPGKIQI